LGYSLYDTIIVFDRIRENVPRMPRAAFTQIVNRSMAEVLTRSLATSFCTLLPVTALMLFGGETLRDFAFALLVGIASGAYSSIFIASPVLAEWKEREPVYRRRRRLVMEEHGGVVPAFATGAIADVDSDGPKGPAARTGRGRLGTRKERTAGRRVATAGAGPAPPVEQEPPQSQAAPPAPKAPEPPAEREPPAAAEPEPPSESEPPAAREAAEPPAEPGQPRSKRQRPRKKHGRR
jgi:SecD/SecF fusion protein